MEVTLDINTIDAINDIVDPYTISPSGDPYWSDKRNVQALDEALRDSKNPNIERVVLKPEDSVEDFIASL